MFALLSTRLRVVHLLAGAEVTGGRSECWGQKGQFDGGALDSVQVEDGAAVGVSGRPKRLRLVQGGGRVLDRALAVSSRGW